MEGKTESKIKEPYTLAMLKCLSGRLWQYDLYTGQLRTYVGRKCYCPITLACLVTHGLDYRGEEYDKAAKIMRVGLLEADFNRTTGR